MINENRLIETFLTLVKIRSESKFEAEIAKKVEEIFANLGFSSEFDEAHKNFGGNCGNMIIRIDGDKSKEAILLSAHLDTVVAGGEIVPVIENGVIKSSGNSILGADDKAGISAIIEVISVLKERKISRPPIIVALSVAEEIGVLGAKFINLSEKDAKFGVVLDTSGEIGTIVKEAPFHDNFTIKIHGKSAHAGIEPEKGINAISLAGELLKTLPTGRISQNSSANLGTISGGTADNIVPNLVKITGEIRSTDLEKIREIGEIYKKSVANFNETHNNCAEILTEREYNGYTLGENSEILQKLSQAAKKIGKTPKIISTGGGSDANFFNEKGIPTSVISCGMANVHTHSEYIKIVDLVDCAKMLLAFVSE